jgi:FtsP/CotA-like multicopper oxidase with cupredoxin domain
VLNQNESVEIAVVNRSQEATSIHWHGVELDSYYDGVPEWGGIGDQKTPAVNPGETFVARMAPPRAGTFIYHTHWHDDAQLTGGVHGPLIVLSPGQAYDPAIDKSVLFSQGPVEPYGSALLLMNGIPQPAVMRLKTGTKYRFRFINITPSVNNLRVSLKRAGTPVQWRIIAKDAVDRPVASAKMRLADQLVAVSETYDVEYEASAPQELTLEGLSPNDMRRAMQTIVFTDPLK